MRQPGRNHDHPPASPARGVLSAWPEGVRVEHRRVLPSPALRPVVEHFWWVRWSLERPFVAQTLSHPTLHITWESGARCLEVTGVHKARFERQLQGQGHVFGVKFRPAMLYQLWPALPAAHLLADRSVPLGELLGAQVLAPWREALERACALEEAAVVSEAFLARFMGAPACAAAVQVRDLVEAVAQDRALLRVEDVAARLGRSRRSLERLHRRYLGVGPKWVIRRYRLIEAAERLLAPGAPSVAELAAELAYFDQPHFVRDFKAVVGCPPRQFMARRATRP